MNFLYSLFFAAAAGMWGYTQLAKRNGNASPSSNALAAGVFGVIVLFVIFTLIQFVFHF